MTQEIYFITGNSLKVDIANSVLESYGIKLKQLQIDAPEIQATTSDEVAKFAAEYVANKTGKTVIKSDVSYHIKALNGFPGPYIKYINKWLNSQQLLRMVEKEKDREIAVVEYIALASPNKQTRLFEGKDIGTIADKITSHEGSAIDQIFIRNGHQLPQSTLSKEEMMQYFTEHCYAWHKLGEYL